MATMTPRERFIAALERRPLVGRVPHFELVFFLTMEAFGKVHPSQRAYHQWDQMSEPERALHRAEMAGLYVQTAERYEHDAIFLHPNPDTLDETLRLIDAIRDKSGSRYYLTLHGDATYSIPSGSEMEDWCAWVHDHPQQALDIAQRRVDAMLEKCHALRRHGGLDGLTLCSDYCLNTGPFLSPPMFRKFVSPFLRQLVQGQRELGFYVIKHTDGNIMPILSELVEAGPHALHSIDPQAGVDLGQVKQLVGDRVALIGNVNCGLLTSGSEAEVAADVRRSLSQGMAGYGYIFSTSNCIFTGMPLQRYDLMLDIWRREATYPAEDVS
ncbi:MAG: hypothetical protein GXX94_11540 [Chloroflexi bacterium]|nr:hypothetical protein [Chloroflexota bacterium]